MAIDRDQFLCLYDLLEGRAQLPKGKDEAEPPAPQEWEPSVLARAIRRRGIMGWNSLDHEGDFESDTPEAQEALAALDDYQSRLDRAAYDPEVIANAERGWDTRRQSFACVYESGPLFRYGWESDCIPPLAKLEADEKVQELSVKEQRNDRKLIGALVAMFLETRGALVAMLLETRAVDLRRSLMRVVDMRRSLNPEDDLARDVEGWAANHGVKGLEVRTVRRKFGEAREALERAKPDTVKDAKP